MEHFGYYRIFGCTLKIKFHKDIVVLKFAVFQYFKLLVVEKFELK